GGRSQTQELAPLMFNGQYWFKIVDPRLFVLEICGNNNLFTTTAVNNYIRGYFNENLIGALSQYTLRQVYGKLKETSTTVKTEIQTAFTKIGLELIDVKFLKIDTEEKYRNRLFFMQTGGVGAGSVMAAETIYRRCCIGIHHEWWIENWGGSGWWRRFYDLRSLWHSIKNRCKSLY
ncbi:MAG: SPFH domain-containing protein, partial [Promethearchaeota archaeon]